MIEQCGRIAGRAEYREAHSQPDQMRIRSIEGHRRKRIELLRQGCHIVRLEKRLGLRTEQLQHSVFFRYVFHGHIFADDIAVETLQDFIADVVLQNHQQHIGECVKLHIRLYMSFDIQKNGQHAFTRLQIFHIA